MKVSVDKVKLCLQQQDDPSLESTTRASQPGIESADAQNDAQVARCTNADIIGELEDVLSGLTDKELELSTVNLIGAPHRPRETISTAFASESPKHRSSTAH